MQAEIAVTRYIVDAIIGWVGSLIGLVGSAVQFVHSSAVGSAFLLVGTIGDGITITCTGPWRNITTRRAALRVPRD